MTAATMTRTRRRPRSIGLRSSGGAPGSPRKGPDSSRASSSSPSGLYRSAAPGGGSLPPPPVFLWSGAFSISCCRRSKTRLVVETDESESWDGRGSRPSSVMA
ncbi:hypothetical protein CDD83_6128 [Cordyceps sp. RAO-2017]|nr:hypothetical protein CDD83_6128 [Cordyceps sp. RAO-2017]